MTSFGADGGIVSTASEMLRFTEAFFKGQLFPLAYLPEMQGVESYLFPMRSVSIHLFKLPWIMNPFGTVPYFWDIRVCRERSHFICRKKIYTSLEL